MWVLAVLVLVGSSASGGGGKPALAHHDNDYLVPNRVTSNQNSSSAFIESSDHKVIFLSQEQIEENEVPGAEKHTTFSTLFPLTGSDSNKALNSLNVNDGYQNSLQKNESNVLGKKEIAEKKNGKKRPRRQAYSGFKNPVTSKANDSFENVFDKISSESNNDSLPNPQQIKENKPPVVEKIKNDSTLLSTLSHESKMLPEPRPTTDFNPGLYSTENTDNYRPTFLVATDRTPLNNTKSVEENKEHKRAYIRNPIFGEKVVKHKVKGRWSIRMKGEIKETSNHVPASKTSSGNSGDKVLTVEDRFSIRLKVVIKGTSDNITNLMVIPGLYFNKDNLNLVEDRTENEQANRNHASTISLNKHMGGRFCASIQVVLEMLIVYTFNTVMTTVLGCGVFFYIVYTFAPSCRNINSDLPTEAKVEEKNQVITVKIQENTDLTICYI